MTLSQALNQKRTTLLVFALSWFLMFASMSREVSMFDEGLVLEDALRVLHGDIIHRDFASPYAPGSYYIIAGLFMVTKYQFIAARLYGTAIAAGIVAASFRMLLVRTTGVVCIAITGVCGLWLFGAQSYLYPVLPMLLAAMVGSMLLLSAIETPRVGYILAAGGCTGAAALFRYDGGFFLLAAHVAALIVTFRMRANLRVAAHRLVWTMLWYGCGVAAVFAPAAVAFLSVASIHDFATDIIDYSVKYYVPMRGLPFPDLAFLRAHPSQWGVYFPPVVLFLAGSIATLAYVGEAWPRTSGPAASSIVMLTALTAAFYFKGIVRPQTVQLLLSIIPATALLGLLISIIWHKTAGKFVAVLCIAVAASSPALSTATQIKLSLNDLRRTPAGLFISSKLLHQVDPEIAARSQDARLTLARLGPVYSQVSEYIKAHSEIQEPIFIGLDRHDKTLANSVALYFSTDRRPATHWHQFDPGLESRADIQMRMIADLKLASVRWVVRDSSYSNIHEPNQSDKSSGVRLLDAFLARNYRNVFAAGNVEIWLLKGLMAPR